MDAVRTSASLMLLSLAAAGAYAAADGTYGGNA